MSLCRYIQDYIDIVRSGEYEVCRYQLLLVDYVEKCFSEEDIYVDEEQLGKYLSYQKYFPYKLFPWEVFCFTLHNCTYKKDGRLRWPVLTIYVGRGAGKNGFLAFEDFCLLTKTNGIPNYNIDIFAMSEDQAKTSWKDVYDVLENNERKMKRHFKWTLEKIVNLDTGSTFCYNTSNPKTKDSYRPGKVDFDEFHAYESYKLVTTATTGLGKVRMPRRTIISTDGDVRDGPLDDLKDKGKKTLEGEIDDNGWLFFMCCIDSSEEVDNKSAWYKANPSLQYFPDLLDEYEQEYADYKMNPASNSGFIKKRLNLPPIETEENITSWENILTTNQPIDFNLIYGRPCVAGIDYMKTTDFLSAGLLFRVEEKDIWITHTWVCKSSKDLKRIHAPIQEWGAAGLLTFVDAPEIPADLPVCWIRMKAAELNADIVNVGIDEYRWQLMRNALTSSGFVWDKKRENSNITLLRPSDEMKTAPLITSNFVNQRFVWGDNPLLRWATWNTKLEINKAGNMFYGKISPKDRKTDPFKALVAAECVSHHLDDEFTIDTDYDSDFGEFGVMTF